MCESSLSSLLLQAGARIFNDSLKHDFSHSSIVLIATYKLSDFGWAKGYIVEHQVFQNINFYCADRQETTPPICGYV